MTRSARFLQSCASLEALQDPGFLLFVESSMKLDMMHRNAAAWGRTCLLSLSALAVLFSAGCTRSLQVGSASTERTVPANTAYILPPPGGPSIVAVTERTYSNGIQQDIALATSSSLPGQNGFRVRLFGPIRAQAEGQTAMPEQFQPLRNVDREIRRVVPGMVLQRAPYYVQNRYGPFGYAVGRRGQEMCLYGFQNIRSREFSWNDRGSVDVRLRLCRTNASEAELLSVMYGYTANVFIDAAGWNPFGNPAAVPETFGAPGAELYPAAQGQLEPVLQPQTEPAIRPVRRPRAVSRPAAEPALPAPIGPAIPLPPNTSIEQRDPSVSDPRVNQSSADSFSTIPLPPANR